MAFLAIELEPHQILVASAKIAKGRCKLDDVFTVPLTDEDDAQIAEKLKSALAEHGLGRSEVIFVVSRSSVEMREVTVPPAPDAELPDMVRLLARNEFASLNDSWLLDYVPLDTDPSVPRAVLAVGVSPEYNRQIHNLTERAGLKIKHIVLRPIAALDLVQNRLTDNRCRLIANQNGDLTDLTIVVGSHPIATRSVRSLQNTEPEKRAREAIMKIKQTFASSAQNLGNRQVEEVLIFGEPDQNNEIRSKLEEELGLKVEFVQPFELVPTSSKLKQPEFPSRYAGLIGSLVHQSLEQPHLLDFLNPRKPPVKKSNRKRIYLYGGMAVAATLVAVVSCWWMLRSQASEIAGLEAKLRTSVKNNEGDGNRPNVEQIMGEVSKIDEWKQEDINWLEELYEFSGRFLTPDDAIVDSFDATLTRDEPRITVKVRGARTQIEEALNEQLEQRPYAVDLGKTSESDIDPSYVSAFDLTLGLVENRARIIDEIDNKAAELLNPTTESGNDSAPENKAEKESPVESGPANDDSAKTS